MKKIWQKAQEGIVLLSERHPNLYGYAYLLGFILMVVAGAALPDVGKSVLYSLAFDKQETEGIITEVVTKEVRVASGRPRKSFLPVNYFEVDGFQILVPSRTVRQYQEGEWYPYYLYEAGDTRIAERKNYTLAGGLAGCFVEAVLFFFGAAFVLTETNKKERMEKEKRIWSLDNIIVVVVALYVIYCCSRFLHYFITLF